MKLEELQEHPSYKSLVETLMTRSVKSYKVARIQLRTMASLDERSQHRLLQEIQLHESMWRKAKTWIMGVLSKSFTQIIKALSPKGIKGMHEKIQKSRKELMDKAKQVSKEQNVSYTKHDIQSFKNEISREMPKIPQAKVDDFNKELGLKEYVEDEAFSTVLFVHKWVLIYILFSIAMYASGAGTIIRLAFSGWSVAAQYFPLIVLTLYDYVDEASKTEYFVR